MRKLHHARDILIGMLLMAILMGLMGAAATQKNITVTTGIPIYVDGVEMKPTDANGNPVDTFVYSGTTYVPLRAVSQYLGKVVKWDGDTRSVYIGVVPGEKQYLLDVCPPYQTDTYKKLTTVNVAGKKYANAFRVGSETYWKGWALYNLNGQYNMLNFDIGHIDGSRMDNGSINIYSDGQVVFSADLKPEMLPTHYEVPLYGALQMKIEGTNCSGSYAFINAEIK